MTTATETNEQTPATPDEQVEIPCALCGKVNCGGHNQAPQPDAPSLHGATIQTTTMTETDALPAAPAQEDGRGVETYTCQSHRCTTVRLTVRRLSPHAFEVVSHAGAGLEPSSGIADDGRPLCPVCEEPMLRVDLEPARLTIAIAAAQTAAPATPQLPFPAPPFDPDQALRKIEGLCQQYSTAIDTHEALKKETSEAREHREELGKQLRDLITDLRRQRAEARDAATAPRLAFDADEAERDRQSMLAADATAKADTATETPAKERARRLPKRHAEKKLKVKAERTSTPSELDREASRVRERLHRNRRVTAAKGTQRGKRR